MSVQTNVTAYPATLLDDVSNQITEWIYSSGFRPEAITFGLIIAVATFIVFIGSYATVSQPKLASDPIYDRHSPLWDPTDRDGSNLYISLTEEALNLNMDKIDMKSALLLPVLAAGALCGLDYLLRLYDILKLRILSYYIVAMAVPAGFMTYNHILTVVLRNVGYWLGLKHNLGFFFSRYRLTLSNDEKFPLGAITPLDLEKMKMSKDELKEYENWMLEHNSVKFLKLHKIEAKKQRFALVWDAKFLFVLPFAALVLFVAYTHLAVLHDRSANWLADDLVGFVLGVTGCKLARASTFKVATLLLVAFFIYDIYFVFGSTLMVSVASTLDLPVMMKIPLPPTKPLSAFDNGQTLYTETAIIGLGDIVLPAIFTSLCLRFDYYRYYARTALPFHHLQSIGVPKYFLIAMAGYVAALVMTVTANHYSKRGQPALLYIVPSLFVGVFGCALASGDFGKLWKYSEDIEEYSKENDKADGEADGNDGDESQSDVEEPYMQVVQRVFEFEVTEDETDDTYIIEDDTDEDEDLFDDEDLSNEIDYLLRDQQEEKK